ncbi:glycosyltransferase family 2 protein [Enterococcus asini]|uniref:glycosyltransferase family 2 protein n=1 Tax=Enterococcus asini TaxID=57732 RepID=UPI002890AABE|nr:glycosyltransferase family 2 protein [Enterococcus asini]MDT2756580.1 glycosyltransferase family 2 protein [Enterococcus asini]
MISVCLASYNGAAFIVQQIESILAQLGPEDELIISDDGSTDGTLEILTSYKNIHSQVKVYEGPKHGVIKNFEAAISRSQGELIFLADQDDVWLPDKVAKMSQAFAENPTAEVVISDLKIVDGQLKPVHASYFDYRQVKEGFWHNLWRSGYIGAGMAFRKELKAKILPFPKQLPMHDMWIGLVARNQVFFLKEPLTLYRRHEKNASEIQSTTSFYQKFIWRLEVIGALMRNRRK